MNKKNIFIKEAEKLNDLELIFQFFIREVQIIHDEILNL